MATTGTNIGSAAITSGAMTRTAFITVPLPRSRCVMAANAVSTTSATRAAAAVAAAILPNGLSKIAVAPMAAKPARAPVIARVHVYTVSFR